MYQKSGPTGQSQNVLLILFQRNITLESSKAMHQIINEMFRIKWQPI